MSFSRCIVVTGTASIAYVASHDLQGNPLGGGLGLVETRTEDYRIDIQTQAAVKFIERHPSDPFFLYVAYFAPHEPLHAPDEYLDRFPDESDERRRIALAMMSAVDDGVGRIMDTVREQGLEEETLVIFLSDNGAPLKGATSYRFFKYSAFRSERQFEGGRHPRAVYHELARRHSDAGL